MRYLLISFLFLSGVAFSAPKFKSAAYGIKDLETGFYLVRSNHKVQRAPASTIKVLSALTAVELEKDLKRYVKISKLAASREPTKAHLRPGEKYRIEDLIKTILVASCNDAATALAEGCSGSESRFAQEMEKVAKKLGANSTRVTNASGLPRPKGMVSTIEDEMLFTEALSKNKLLAGFMAVKKFELTSQKGRKTLLINHNKLLFNYAYPVRGKTGYTRLAKHCFSSYVHHNNRKIAVCILGAPNSKSLWLELQKAYWFALNDKKAYLPTYMKQRNLSPADLHKALKSKGFPLSQAEAHYGIATKRAVQAFQKQRGLSADGIAGPRTWRHLK